MKTITLALFALSAILPSASFAEVETCSHFKSQRDALIKQADLGSSAFYQSEKVFTQFCTEYRISEDCHNILDLMAKNLSFKQFEITVQFYLRGAYLNGYMNSREEVSFSGLVETMYAGLLTNNDSIKKALPIEKKMNAMKCYEVKDLSALTDTALISASKQGKTGVCTVATVKGGKFKVLVKGEDYPLEGVTYTSISELAQSLKEALDTGLCF